MNNKIVLDCMHELFRISPNKNWEKFDRIFRVGSFGFVEEVGYFTLSVVYKDFHAGPDGVKRYVNGYCVLPIKGCLKPYLKGCGYSEKYECFDIIPDERPNFRWSFSDFVGDHFIIGYDTLNYYNDTETRGIVYNHNLVKELAIGLHNCFYGDCDD